MRPFWANLADRHYPTNMYPALKPAIRDVCRLAAPLAAYVGALAVFVIVGIHVWNEFPADDAVESSTRSAWSLATRSHPAFAISKINTPDKTESYQIFRHPGGGRKDVIQWGPPGQKPLAELELYRLGSEWNASDPVIEDIALRMDAQRSQKGVPEAHPELESAGIINTKFGPVKLLGPAERADHTGSCLGFLKRFDALNLQMSGWSCQGETLPAKRAAVSCLLNRLVLLTAGNEPKLAEFFARAELKRSSCSASATPPLSADWVTGTDNPRLRGLL